MTINHWQINLFKVLSDHKIDGGVRSLKSKSWQFLKSVIVKSSVGILLARIQEKKKNKISVKICGNIEIN